MLEAHIAAGFDPEAFWGLTMRLFQAQMNGARLRMEREANSRLSQAWMTAALSRQTRLPTLDRLLKRASEPVDPEFALRSLSAELPKITLAEWRARSRQAG